MLLTDAEVPALVLFIWVTSIFSLMFWWLILTIKRDLQAMMDYVQDVPVRKKRRIVIILKDGTRKEYEQDI